MRSCDTGHPPVCHTLIGRRSWSCVLIGRKMFTLRYVEAGRGLHRSQLDLTEYSNQNQIELLWRDLPCLLIDLVLKIYPHSTLKQCLLWTIIKLYRGEAVASWDSMPVGPCWYKSLSSFNIPQWIKCHCREVKGGAMSTAGPSNGAPAAQLLTKSAALLNPRWIFIQYSSKKCQISFGRKV